MNKNNRIQGNITLNLIHFIAHYYIYSRTVGFFIIIVGYTRDILYMNQQEYQNTG
jgi:hypothetical protein